MNPGLIDREAWRRAWGPAMKAFGYFTAIYVLITILILLPASIIGLGGIVTVISIAALVFTFFLAVFKVMDEQRPGEIPLQLI